MPSYYLTLVQSTVAHRRLAVSEPTRPVVFVAGLVAILRLQRFPGLPRIENNKPLTLTTHCAVRRGWRYTSDIYRDP